jgi:5'-nucleotidase
MRPDRPLAGRLALVTNDDGIDSPGLHALARAAREAGMDVIVAAPMGESSGASAAIIAAESYGRLVIERRELPGLPEVEAHAVDALPAHIVLAATRGWLDPMPDVVLSGVNRGPNVGRAILHSGTVGAALTASVNGARGLAVSLAAGYEQDDGWHWESAVELLPELVELLLAGPAGAVLSLNVPNLPVPALAELRLARLAEFGMVQARFDRDEEGRLQLVVVGLDRPPQQDTDSALLAAGHPTLTAIESVREADGPEVTRWLRSGLRGVGGAEDLRPA